MKNKDFREIQVSSSLLVVIFLGVLALGVFIFLLGVSVGKRQVRLTAETRVVSQQIPEPAKEIPVKPASAQAEPGPGASSSQTAASELAAKPLTKESASKRPSERAAVEPQKAPAGTAGLYYVQVAAFTERAQAQALADRYKTQGYATVIDPRPTSTKTWYRVRLGGYASRDRAADLLSKLNAAAGKKTDFQIVHD